MADFALCDGVGATGAGVTLATTIPFILGGGGNNVYGSWVQLTAATPFEVQGMWVYYLASGDQFNNIVDIGIGAPASEVVVVQALSAPNINGVTFQAYLPILLPSGVRVAARQQSSGGAQTIDIAVAFVGTGFANSRLFGSNVLYGYTPASTTFVTVDPGGSANTKGSWAQITASTTAPASMIDLEIGPPANTGAANYAIDVAVGGSGSEKVILSNLFLRATNSSRPDQSIMGPFPVNIPTGTRLSARCQSTTSGGGTRALTLGLRTWG